jgi:hypothetical protein
MAPSLALARTSVRVGFLTMCALGLVLAEGADAIGTRTTAPVTSHRAGKEPEPSPSPSPRITVRRRPAASPKPAAHPEEPANDIATRLTSNCKF